MSSIMHKTTIEQTFELLIKCMMQFKHSLTELGSEYDLSSMQAMMIMLLDEPGSMNSFAKLFNCDASNVTGIVDGLEQKKLASRFPDTKDRRIKMIKLSPKGESIRKKLLSKLVDKNGLVNLNLKHSDLDAFISLLEKITLP